MIVQGIPSDNAIPRIHVTQSRLAYKVKMLEPPTTNLNLRHFRHVYFKIEKVDNDSHNVGYLPRSQEGISTTVAANYTHLLYTMMFNSREKKSHGLKA